MADALNPIAEGAAVGAGSVPALPKHADSGSAREAER
jgi:hypothetical protein